MEHDSMEHDFMRPRRALLAVLLAAPFLAQADATIANVAAPSIGTDLGASSAAVELVVGGYLIAFAVLLITGARLGQTHGYKRIFMLGVAAFGVTSLLNGLAPNAAVLVGMRVLQGAAAALMFPQALTGIQLNFDGAWRQRAIGWYALALSAGAVTGQVLGGAVIWADIAGTGWRAIFLINVPACVAVLAAAARRLPSDGARCGRRIHLLGVATLSVAVLLIVLPLTLGRVDGWPAWTWLSLAASAPAAWLFFKTQRDAGAGGRTALVDLGMLARPPIAFAILALAAATSTYYGLLFTLAQYVQHGLGRGSLASGLILLPWVAVFGLAGQVTRRLPARYGPALPAAGCLVLAAAYVAIGAGLLAGLRDLILWVPLLAAGGFGLGTQFSSLIGHLTAAVQPRHAPDISGTQTTMVQIGGALGVAAFGAVYLGLAAPPGAGTATPAFAVTALAMAATALVAAAAAWRATHTRVPERLDRPAPVRAGG
ncbi:MAG TPA: MFS transporter [Streptosporangiaceae bacterium]